MLARAEIIRELHALGFSDRKIAEHLRAEPRAINRQARAMGLPANYVGRRFVGRVL